MRVKNQIESNFWKPNNFRKYPDRLPNPDRMCVEYNGQSNASMCSFVTKRDVNKAITGFSVYPISDTCSDHTCLLPAMICCCCLTVPDSTIQLNKRPSNQQNGVAE